MNRFYEGTLPEGYQEAFVVDANDKDSYSKLTTATLLINTSRQIEEIARNSGFPTLSHFNRCFKSYYGCSPWKYRERHR